MPANLIVQYFRRMRTHEYRLQINWTGNTGSGTKHYTAYSRDHEIMAPGKVVLEGSADPAFRGNPTKYNPEELFLSSISTCHMLWFLHLCADAGIVITSYVDHPIGFMIEGADFPGKFTRVELHPMVEMTDPERQHEISALHDEAGKQCFIANSCNFPIEVVL